MLKSTPELKLAIEGHTDDLGHTADCPSAAPRAVMAAVVAGGIDAQRLSTAGFGQEHPVAANRSEDGRAKNRRVVLVKQ